MFVEFFVLKWSVQPRDTAFWLPTSTLVAWVGCSAVFVSVCIPVFVLPRDISKSDAARITKLDIDTVHYESRKSICFGVKRSKVEVTRYKNIASVGHDTLVSAVFFWFFVQIF